MSGRSRGWGGAPRAAWRPAALAGAAVVPLALALGFTRNFDDIFPRKVVRRDHTATVVAAGEGMNRRMFVNGAGMTALTPVTKMMAHLPLAFLETEPQRGLVLCFGMGTSFRSMRSWGIATTVVELVPSVPELFGYYHADGPAVLRSPDAHVVIDDARRFLERSSDLFDVITVDPPPPVEAAGSSLLYSREFYEVARARLRPGGVLQQWLPYGDLIVWSAVTRALRAVFPYVRVFLSIEGIGCHFLASDRPIPDRSAQALAERFPPAASADLLEWGPKATAERQLAAVVGRELPADSAIALDPRAPVLTDDRPVNEYFFLRRLLRKSGEAKRG